jgi:lipopolysaccharide transport system ATP-binding protein
MGKKNIAIEVERISKIYRIGVKESIHDSLGNAIFDFIRRPLKNFRKYRSLYRFDDVLKDSSEDNSPPSDDVIWALKDVSFKVAAGEVVGIIGVNGAGKSTLLKILSHITDPTTGRAKIRGRISSLLEVGTGFHPELTGRENIYLNGTILGMRKKEIDLKFDEIVAFSGVERFIDTPVKRYSSGMRVRLAFAVSAHLEPEILLIDEVLAVGDASFQKKCLNKMHDVGEEGRTVLFVSHNMPAITRICPRTILLNNGSVIMDGPSHEVVSHYLTSDAGLPRVGRCCRRTR